MRTIVPGVLLSAILCLLPATLHAQASPACASIVFVRAGDTLSALAARQLGNGAAYDRIVAATNAAAQVDGTFATIANPGRVGIGWKLCIPAADPGSSAPTPAPTTAPALSTPQPATPAADETEPAAEISATADISATVPIDGEQLTIAFLREQNYPGSPIVVEETLTPGANYDRYLVSYRSRRLEDLCLDDDSPGGKT